MLYFSAGESPLALQYLSQVKVPSQPEEVVKLRVEALTAYGNVSAAFELVVREREREKEREREREKELCLRKREPALLLERF